MTRVLVEPVAWAEQQFGNCDFGDFRRTKRLVHMATQAAARPDGSTPDQTESWGECKAVYRLMNCEDVSHAEIIRPHCEQTRQSCPPSSVQLILCDTTDVNFGRCVPGLGPVSNKKRWGEEYHKALKTGCHVEERYYQTSERLERVTGMNAILALRLLQMRTLANEDPDLQK